MTEEENKAVEQGLSDLLLSSVRQANDFVQERVAVVEHLHDNQTAYIKKLRGVFDHAKYVRECEAALIEQITASLPGGTLQAEQSVSLPPPPEVVLSSDDPEKAQQIAGIARWLEAHRPPPLRELREPGPLLRRLQ